MQEEWHDPNRTEWKSVFTLHRLCLGTSGHVEVVHRTLPSATRVLAMASTSNEAVAGVVNNARQHEDLLLQLSELDYAGEALKQAEERLAELEKSLPEQRRALEKSARSSRKEFADWERVSHSIVTRAGARIKGAVGRAPLEARIEKEEQEWLDALREVRL